MSFPVAIYPSNVADADLVRRIVAYLASRSHLSFRRLHVQSQAGVVRLTGQLSTYHEKQVAQESVRRVAGVLRVIDAVEVVTVRTGPRGMGSDGVGAGRVTAPPNFAAPARRIELPPEIEIALACS